MSRHSSSGFTIIETMLVLAITGILIVGLLVGVGSSITIQRYRDSVISFQALLQSQFSELDNVRNDRNANWSCDSSAQPTEGGATNEKPGQSDCVILGRYMTVVGGAITTATVIGNETGNSPAANDIEALTQNYAVGISTASIETGVIEWGAEIAWPQQGDDTSSSGGTRSIALLFLRSPTSGTTYTFTSDAVAEPEAVNSQVLKTMMVAGRTIPGQAERVLCMDPVGAVVPEKMAVIVGAGATNVNAIETRTYSTFQSLGGNTEC